MPAVEDSAHLASDAELITSVRAGDRQAFGDLYSRHASAAAALARQFARSPAEADDLVSEAFARVLDGLLEGKGPDTAFRAYLFTTVRNTAYDRTRKDKRLQFTDDIESHDQPADLDDPVIADLENGLVGRAFAGLPERWQTVLWHVQVEGQSPAEVGVLMGMAPNAVSSLAFRAREGLREAYLQAHLAETAADQCRTTVDRLGAWTRGGLSKRERAQVDAHLQVCDRCPALAAELSEINTSLRGLLAPLLLGGAAAGYIATLGPIAPLVQLGTFTGGATIAGSTAANGTAVAGKALAGKAVAAKVLGGKAVMTLAKVGPWAPGAAVAGVAAVAVAVVASVVLTLSGGGGSAPAVAGSNALAPTVATTSQVGGAGGGSGSTDDPGTDAPGAGGAGGATPGSTEAGTTAPTPSTPAVPSSGPVVPGAPGSGTSTAPSSLPGAVGTVTGPNGSPLPGDVGTTEPATGTGTAVVPTTDGIADPTTTDLTTPATTDPGTTDPATTDPGTTDPATTDPATTDPETTPVLPPDPSSPVDPSSGGTTAPTGSTEAPTTDPPVTEPPTTNPPVTEPPTPARLSVSATAVTDVIAGSAATVSVTVENSGGTAAAAGQTVVLGVPDGVSIGVVLLGSPLRTPHAFAAVADPGCTQQIGTINCVLPEIAAESSFDLTVVLDVSPDVADGDIDVMLNGVVTDGAKIPLTVQSGYASVQLSSPDDLPLARAAVNAVRLVAVPKTGVRDAGLVTVGGSDVTVLAVHGDNGKCTVVDGRVRCPAAAVATQAGVTLDLAMAGSATAPVMTAVDQRGRTVAAASALTVADTGIGGYASVLVTATDPGHLLRAGATDLVRLSGTLLNAGVVNAGPITVPVQLSPGLRIEPRTGADLPAGCVAADDAVTCTPADSADPAFELPVQVSSAATGPQQLGDAVLPAGPTGLTDAAERLTVDPTRSGYDRITLTPTGPLAAGAMGTLRLDTVVGAQVTEPGPVRIDRQPAPGLLITAAAGCERDGEQYLCPPVDGGDPAPVVTVAVLPLATADPALAPAALDGDRRQGVEGAIGVAVRAPGQRISLTGPFGGTTVGAATLRCEKAGVDNRNGCPGGLTQVASSSATLTVPAGATVISAELTWAATAPAVLPVSTLDTVDVTIDGVRTGTVSGVLPVGFAGDITGANPLTSGQLFQRVATADAQQLLAAGASAGTHTVSISNLAAKTTGARISAMGAWSLTVLWSTTGSADVGVLTDNRSQYSSSTRAGAVTTIEPAGNAVTSIYQTVWAPDPWGKKTLAIGGVPITTAINGRHGNRLDGFELLHPTLPAGGLTGAITLTNQLTPPSALNPDGLWLGPLLVITAP